MAGRIHVQIRKKKLYFFVFLYLQFGKKEEEEPRGEEEEQRGEEEEPRGEKRGWEGEDQVGEATLGLPKVRAA